jgi:hypothetical protein
MYRKIFENAFHVVCAIASLAHTLLTLLATEWMRSLMQLEERQSRFLYFVSCAMLLAGDSMSRQPTCL